MTNTLWHEELNDAQRAAIRWQDGAALVLAGPGSGKTKVLTLRIARLLCESPDSNFRILALTFTNKAADEMLHRVNALAPDMEQRLFIGTFHGFCAQILRQHGLHLGIQSNFAIYSSEEDRKQILLDATKETPNASTVRDAAQQVLRMVDKFLYRFATPENTAKLFKDSDEGRRYAEMYAAYEQELRRLNALDLSSLLHNTYHLLTEYPAIAERYQRSYPYWLLDEFQDTNTPQYRLITALAGARFKNIFVVADDDQIIYEWNGASYKQLQRFRNDFTPETIQLPTSYRCPPTIIAAANKLVVKNNSRTPDKEPLVAAKAVNEFPEHEHIRVYGYANEIEEAEGIVAAISASGQPTWGGTVVLARNRPLLAGLLPHLKVAAIPATIAQRRDHFLSPQFRWLHFTLRQVVRPIDKSNFVHLVNAYNKMTGMDVSAQQFLVEAEHEGRDYLNLWAEVVRDSELSTGTLVTELADRHDLYPGFSSHFEKKFRDLLAANENDPDLADDCLAWQELRLSIVQSIGNDAPLDQFLQQLDLRSKEPTPPANTVRLMTIHAAKGTEANYVYVMGMAEGHIPSYRSVQEGDQSHAMEEERRNCFVAITRTKEQLTLSTAKSYQGWAKRPSRFLHEMELLGAMVYRAKR
jgi:DNA helicase II / ATP-dependent DNA helicase PcrA